MTVKCTPIIGSLVFLAALLDARMMDMSHILSKHAIHGQIFRNFSMTTAINGSYNGVWFQANDVHFAEHTGTHMDAPVHSYPKGLQLHELPYKQLVGPAVVLDIIEQAKTDQDYALKVSDIQDYELAYGRIPDGAIVFLNTGGSDLYHDAVKYLGKERPWELTVGRFPGFSAEAANWLIAERKIKGLGSDRLSFDIGQAPDFPVHKIIGRRNVFGLENVANMDKIPKRGATVVVLPMAVEGGTGFPTRIMAFWGNNNELFYSPSPRIGGSPLVMAICLILITNIQAL